jgi:hypothetical protein
LYGIFTRGGDAGEKGRRCRGEGEEMPGRRGYSHTSVTYMDVPLDEALVIIISNFLCEYLFSD